jgi:hypothetical protein
VQRVGERLLRFEELAEHDQAAFGCGQRFQEAGFLFPTFGKGRGGAPAVGRGAVGKLAQRVAAAV